MVLLGILNPYVFESCFLLDVAYQYYADGSLSRLDDGINQGRFGFEYELNGLRKTLERPNHVTTYYSYDALGRLARVSHENSLNKILQRFDYTYDVDTIDGTGNPIYKGLRSERGVDGKRKRREWCLKVHEELQI